MPTTPFFPTIPVPTEDPKALLETCLTMKRTLEMLTGEDQGGTYAVHTFVQADTPEAIHLGDFWLCTAKDMSLNTWTGLQWVKIASVTALAAAEVDFNMGQFQRRPR